MKGKLMIMLLLIGSILFGDPVQQDSKSFNIHLTITPVHAVKILKAVPANVGDFNSAPTITGHGFTELATAVSTYYMVIKTNNKSAVNIDVVVENMKSTGIDAQIAYKIHAGGITVTSTKDATTWPLFTEATPLTKNGMRIVSQSFIIALNSSDVNDATSATYTSDITFKLMAP